MKKSHSECSLVLHVPLSPALRCSLSLSLYISSLSVNSMLLFTALCSFRFFSSDACGSLLLSAALYGSLWLPAAFCCSLQLSFAPSALFCSFTSLLRPLALCYSLQRQFLTSAACGYLFSFSVFSACGSLLHSSALCCSLQLSISFFCWSLLLSEAPSFSLLLSVTLCRSQLLSYCNVLHQTVTPCHSLVCPLVPPWH